MVGILIHIQKHVETNTGKVEKQMRQTRRPARLLGVLLLCACLLIPSVAGAVPAGLLMRLSTRTGPGTQYDEPGTYFQNDWRTAQVEVISAAWDKHNEIWWVQVEFAVRNTWYRAYTGLKRVNVDIHTVMEEYPLGTATMTSAAKAYWGPGAHYAMAKLNVPYGTGVTVFGAENGFVQVEFYDARTAVSDRSLRRAWVNEAAVSGNWSSPYASPLLTPLPAYPIFSFCPSCGQRLADGNNFIFCPYCGKALQSGN